MQCNSKKIIRARAEATANSVWDRILECLIDDECIFAITVKRYFGFGHKRLNDFLDFYDKVRSEFEEHNRDGLLDKRIKDELMEVGIDFSEKYKNTEKFNDARKRFSQIDKPNVTEKEASEIQDTMVAFMNSLRDEKPMNIKKIDLLEE